MRTFVLAVALAVTLGGAAHAQNCPNVPGDAFAFINTGTDECPADPGVRWADAQTVYDCDFFADSDKAIDCSGDAATCIGLCRDAANVWNADLPGRFRFNDATDAVDFCDTDDGRISIGGTQELCDGSNYGQRVLAVTLSIFFSSGPQAGDLIDANITVNQAFKFTQEGFQATLAHELGHALGLSHPDQCDKDFNVLMRSASLFLSSDPCFVVDPTSADINGARRVYPNVNPTPTPVVTPGVTCGDADQSGGLTVTDGVNVLRSAAGLDSLCSPERCDVDGNGQVTVTDGVNVLRGATGLSFEPNCP